MPRVERQTEYRAVRVGGRAALRATARCSASARALRLDAIDLARTPMLRWSWWAERLSPVEDERSRAGDDFAARVSVLFPFESERASWLERLRHEFAKRLAGRETPGTLLYFVWTTREAPGNVWKSPRADEAVMWALERGPADGWREAEVDVASAYRRAFGREAPPPVGIALMSDSDDHCGESQALYADLRFGVPRKPKAAAGIEGTWAHSPERVPSPTHE